MKTDIYREKIECPEINLNIYIQLISENNNKIHDGERTVSSIGGVGKTV
jgi:hypothetical protein